MSSTTAIRNADLDGTLAEARETYIRRRPESLARHVEAAAVMPGGNTRSVLYHGPFPFAVAHGEGCRLRDADGIEYVNMIGEYTAGLFGHSHPAIRAAIQRALDTGLNLTAHNLFEAKLARLVRERFPSIEMVRFTNSGTEANLLAVATAKITTGRQTILAMQGGYHGGLMTFAGGGNPINVPHKVVLCEYNDVADAERVARENAGDLAAIILEPMLGGGGCIPATEDFLRTLRRLADETGAVLIFDEVMTSRLSPGGLQLATGVIPDMTTLGKYIGGGMSFGAFGGREKLMAIYDPRRADAIPHAGTFNNNTLTMSCGVTALSELYPPAKAVELNARGDALRERLNAAMRSRGLPAQVTGRGSMMCFHFTDKPLRNAADAGAANQKLKELLFLDLLERGYYIARRGMVALSLMVGDKECDGFVGAVEEFLDLHGGLMRA
jgi:glutamate-1-semialdehyde 2,1-aminomutase